MKTVYLDTNILIYQSSPQSSNYNTSSKFIKHCQINNILLLTSTETYQEIIYFMQRTKQLHKGLMICNEALKLTETLDITKKTITIYLSLLPKHKNLISRDALHIATCIEHNINIFVTYDKRLLKTTITTIQHPKNVINN